MKIIKRDNIYCSFSSIKKGELFIFENVFFMNICQISSGFNAVNLEDGTLHTFQEYVNVIPAPDYVLTKPE